MTPHQAVTAGVKARESLGILAANLRRAAKSPSEAEPIHHLRVSIRRFNQVLRVFDGLFGHRRKMRRPLREFMDLCGEARDCDIAVEVLAAAGKPADAKLEKGLKQRRTRASRELARRIKHWNVNAHSRRWRGWLTVKSGDDTSSATKVPRSLAREFLAAGRAAAQAGSGFRQMHKFRLLVKRYRYSLEILGEEVPGVRIDTLRGLQERLGAINDCVTTTDLIDEAGLSPAGKRTIKAALNRLLASRAAEFRVYWRSHFQRPRTPSGVMLRRVK